MDIFLGKQSSKVSTKVTSKVKHVISEYCSVLGITESQYLRRALQNQIKADKGGIVDYLDSLPENQPQP